MKANKEYQTCKAIATYLKYQYPDVIFRFDQAGLNLSMAQAGMNKVIQYGKGWPDLFIAEPRRPYKGLFIEVKAEGIKLLKQNGDYATPHLQEQADFMFKLRLKGYWAVFAVGFDQAVEIIKEYLG